MRRKVAILRGINVGGKRKILMSDLKSLCEKIEFENVTTYIQSGNVIFESEKPNHELENILEKAIVEKFGFDVPVIIRTKRELETSIKNNPFFYEGSDIGQLHLTFLKETPSQEQQQELATYNYVPDKFKQTDKEVFVFCEGKYHKSKLSNNFFEKKLKVGATTRNWKTVLKLWELLQK